MTLTRIRRYAALPIAVTLAVAAMSCRTSEAPAARSFATPEQAVGSLIAAAKASKVDDVAAMFGPDAKDLIDTSDPERARQNRQVFVAAAAEKWQLVDEGDHKVLVIGNEGWPFPIPLAKDSRGWHFDTSAGKEEVLARRVGRNELAVIAICRAYVAAQKIYAVSGHDGQPAGLYAQAFRSDTGRQNGLYWPAAHGQKQSPLGDLIARASLEGQLPTGSAEPSPFHGYYFKILTAQGADVAGGAQDYVVNGKLARGFALVAWPAQYDLTGVMTFVVNQDGVVREKDLGADTQTASKQMGAYNPDGTWSTVQ